jgi:hypothetical protein
MGGPWHYSEADASPVPLSPSVCRPPGSARPVPLLEASRCHVVPERDGSTKTHIGSVSLRRRLVIEATYQV